MNVITVIREAGPEAPPLAPTAWQSARAALLTEIDASRSVRGRLRGRLPSRRTGVRIGLAAVTAAAAWTTAVVVAAPDGPPGPPPGDVTLVAFEPPTFPLALDPVPAGLAASFSADPGGILHAGYSSADGENSISLTMTPEEPDLVDTSDEEEVMVRGREGELVTEKLVYDNDDVRPSAAVVVEWHEDQWVKVTGGGRWNDRDRLLAAARSLVDRPQPVPLQVHLAPAGWSVQAYKDDRILTLVNDAYEQQTLNVYLPEQALPADQVRGELMGPVGPMIPVIVNERPAQLVQVDTGPIDAGWFLQAQFADGRTFVVQAPAAFTQEEVLAFAAEVTYTP